MFSTRKTTHTHATIFSILTRKRRDMFHKMAVLTSISVLTIVFTIVYKASPAPTDPELLQKSGISKSIVNFNNVNVNGVEESIFITQGETTHDEEVELSPNVLQKHHRVLQFTDTTGANKEDASMAGSSPSTTKNKNGGDDISNSDHPKSLGFPDIKTGDNQHSEDFGKTSEYDYAEDSKVIQMIAASSAETEQLNSHIPFDSVGDNTEQGKAKHSEDVQMLVNLQQSIPSESVQFKFVGESKLAVQHDKESSYSSVGRLVDKPKRVPKPNRNASYRNTSEVPVRRLPRAIIIGVKKSGTRALLEFMRMHPGVEGSGPEPHFFDRNYNKGLEWYRSLMPKTYEDQITIEKTPSYFITEEAPRRILQMNPQVKLILVVRDPVTRAISDYCQAASKRPAMPPFEQRAMLDQRRGVVNATWAAIRIGIYYRHMEKWLETFTREQIHLVDMQKLITEPAKELAKVERFLHLSPFITDDHFYLHKFKGMFPCMIRKGKTHCLDGRSKGREHPKVKASVLKRLRRFYSPFNSKFYQMVGHDFGWPVV